MVIDPKSKHPSKIPHPDLLLAKDLVYKPSGFILQNLKIENESANYGASEFTLKNRTVKFRVGKITPTKIGQFVTFWKRIEEGPILPYEFADFFDFLVISVRDENQFGQFVFPKAVLCEKGIVSCNGKEGKRAMRIYPPWNTADHSQARKAQEWQLQFFIKFSVNVIDFSRMRYLFDIQDRFFLPSFE